MSNTQEKIDWNTFYSLPLIETYMKSTGKPIEITEGAEIVTFVKAVDYFVGMLRIGTNVDFVGCSPNYVIEKVNLAISSLQWIKQRVKEVSK